jgi:hypothetical protein
VNGVDAGEEPAKLDVIYIAALSAWIKDGRIASDAVAGVTMAFKGD